MIGVLMPVLNERSISQMRYLAAELAVKEINNSGGVLGRPLKLVRKDDEGDVNVGVQRANEFISEGINLVVGPGWSGITLAVAEQVAIANILTQADEEVEAVKKKKKIIEDQKKYLLNNLITGKIRTPENMKEKA